MEISYEQFKEVMAALIERDLKNVKKLIDGIKIGDAKVDIIPSISEIVQLLDGIRNNYILLSSSETLKDEMDFSIDSEGTYCRTYKAPKVHDTLFASDKSDRTYVG